MKTLISFLSQKPSYVKCGNQRIANAAGISINTVARFKKSKEFKNLYNLYLTNA